MKHKTLTLQQRAEEFLNRHQVPLTETTSEYVKKLIEDLNIHQIELEIQNEELRRVQTELEASRDKFSDLYDFAPVGYVTISGKGIILQANITCTDMLGIKRNTLIGMPFTHFIEKEDQKVFYRYYKLLFETNAKQICELKLVRKDGSRFYAQLESSTVKGINGDIPQIRTSIIDINKRQMAEEALKEKDEQLRIAIEGGRLGIWNRNLTTNEVIWDDSLYTLLGRNPKGPPIDEGTFFTYIHPDDIERVRRHVEETLENGTDFFDEFRVVREDKEVRWLAASCRVYRDKNGQPLRIAGVNYDITARKHAEKALQTAHDDLEATVKKRTAQLADINEELKAKIEEHRTTEEDLRNALLEIKALQSRLVAERAYLQEEIRFEYNYENIIGNSNALRYTLYKVEQIAQTDTAVLILGETGTGKELIARAIHGGGPRKNRSLVKVNCAALPHSLMESELFGHERGAFSGAVNGRPGRFEVADGATLFLDEIGELPFELQAKLLRVLQDGEFERVGSSHTVKVDVRIIAATNRDLENEVKKGRFRKDLWYRLSVFPITVPPLRDRREDIPALVEFFVDEISKRMGKSIDHVPQGTMDTLQKYYWPGNIRELKNVIERAVINSPKNKLRLMDSLKNLRESFTTANQTMEKVEHDHIVRILKKTRWKVSGKNGAAEILGLNPSTLHGRMRKLGIRRPKRSNF